jgi:predicted PurR-regulated permease PerM
VAGIENDRKSGNDFADRAHHDLVGQPHSDAEGPVAEAEKLAAKLSSAARPLGSPGRPFDRRSPFYIGLTASAGVALTYGAVRALASVSSMLVLIGVALFLALGLEPAVSWLVAHKWPRWAATTLVFVVLIGLIVGGVGAAIPPLARQAGEFIDQAPHYIQQAQDHASTIGKLNDRFHVQQRITETINGSGGKFLADIVNAGTAVFKALADALIVVVLAVYFLVDMPRIRTTVYRLVPRSRRPRAILIGDQVFAKVGAYVLGNVLTSVIAGAATFVWLVIFGVPYPLLLALLVALLDLIPTVGSTIAGVIVAAVALTVSLSVCIATVAFFIAFRLAEDYLLVPKIIGRTVNVPAVTTVVAILIGGALLGIVGALVAIPIAAAIQIFAEAVVYPRLDES